MRYLDVKNSQLYKVQSVPLKVLPWMGFESSQTRILKLVCFCYSLILVNHNLYSDPSQVQLVIQFESELCTDIP